MLATSEAVIARLNMAKSTIYPLKETFASAGFVFGLPPNVTLQEYKFRKKDLEVNSEIFLWIRLTLLIEY